MNKKSILIVEDEKIISHDIKRILMKFGYEVLGIAVSGKEVLAQIKKQKPDLILMDIVLEGDLSGIETAEKIKEHWNIPIIYLTAFADEQTLQRAMITIPYGYILKPFEEKELYAIVEMAFHKHKLEKNLQESVEYSRNIINSSLDMIITIDNDGKIFEFNKAAEEIFGYQKADIEGKPFSILFSENERATEILATTLKKKKSTFEVVNKRSNEELFHSFFSASVMYDHQSKAIGIMGISRELTEQKQSEKKLRELKEAVETLRLGVTITDINGKIIYTNPADAELHGYKVRELIGKNVRIFAPVDLRRRTSLKQIKKWTGLIRESKNVRKDGSIFPTWLISNVVKDNKGNPIAIVTTCEDITERKEMQKQLLRSERLAGIGELAAGIAHEIRNPLGNISSSAQFCLNKFELDDDLKQFMEIILRNSENANKIIKELLDFANPRTISLKPGNINEIITDVIKLVSTRCLESGIKIKINKDEKIPEIMIDQKWLEQAFLNFILNAKESMPDGGILEIETLSDLIKKEIKVVFSDSGVGISKENIKKIFDPFFTTKTNGVGLGLSLVHQIISAHKGKINIDSIVGKGTKFQISLPVNYNPKQDSVK